MSNMLLSKADKEKRVIELHREKKTIRQIASEVRMGFSDISAIIHNHFDEPEAAKKSTPSKFCAAVKLFKKGASLSDTVIKLDLTADEAERFYVDYWRLKRMHSLYYIYRENKKVVPSVLHLYNLLEKKRIRPNMYDEVADLIENQMFRADDPTLKSIELSQMSEDQALESGRIQEWLESAFPKETP
ncbi:MAG: hypothetical protein ABJB85_09880 [Nitrososphaerota archaeon]